LFPSVFPILVVGLRNYLEQLQQRSEWLLGPAMLSISLLLSSTMSHADDRVRAQVVSPNQSTLSAEIAAKIIELPFREGDAFKEGDTLIAFDCSFFKTQRDKSAATAELAQQALITAQRLHDLQMSSDLELQQAEAKAKETAAEAEGMRVTVNKCSFVAPYNGRVSKLGVALHQFVTAGTPMLEIMDMRKLEVQVAIPSRWLVWLKAGSQFSIHVDEMGRAYQAKVIRTGAKIDAVSQMVSITGEISGNPPELIPGMSGWAAFRQRR